MMFAYRFRLISTAAIVLAPLPAFATQPKLDTETCNQLRLEHMKYVASGAADELQRGPEWGKNNLAQDKLRDLELFMQLDEQIKFGCRDAKLTMDAERAGEAAKRLELNPDADPTAPAPEPSGDSTSDDDADGPSDDAPAATTVKPKLKPKVERRQKPASDAAGAAPKVPDAYAPPPGTESTLAPPAGASTAVP